MKNIFYVLTVLLLCTNLYAENNQTSSSTQALIPCMVSSITDGDTIRVITPSQQEQKIRTYGIDCPEPGQDYGPEATERLRKLIDGQYVTLDVKDTDRYGRTVAIIMKDSVDIGLLMVREGYAWASRKYLGPAYLKKYIEAETYARNKKLGLWKNGMAIEPWVYRKKFK